MQKLWCKRFVFSCLIFILVTAVLFNSSCKYGGIISLLGTPSYDEQEIPAEYSLTEQMDQKILILVKQAPYLNTQANLRFHLTEAINKYFTSKIEFPSDNLISYSQLSEFRSNNSDFALLSAAEVGRALGADMVLLVMIEDYQVKEVHETGYYKGLLDMQTLFVETETGEKLWPESAKTRSIKVGFDIERLGGEIAVKRLIVASAHCITRYFYNCRKKHFKIADDRSGISWESWGR